MCRRRQLVSPVTRWWRDRPVCGVCNGINTCCCCLLLACCIYVLSFGWDICMCTCDCRQFINSLLLFLRVGIEERTTGVLLLALLLLGNKSPRVYIHYYRKDDHRTDFHRRLRENR